MPQFSVRLVKTTPPWIYRALGKAPGHPPEGRVLPAFRGERRCGPDAPVLPTLGDARRLARPASHLCHAFGMAAARGLAPPAVLAPVHVGAVPLMRGRSRPRAGWGRPPFAHVGNQARRFACLSAHTRTDPTVGRCPKFLARFLGGATRRPCHPRRRGDPRLTPAPDRASSCVRANLALTGVKGVRCHLRIA